MDTQRPHCGVARCNVEAIGMPMARMLAMLTWLRRGFLRKPATGRFNKRHVTDVATIIARVIMHLRVGAIGAASDGKDVMLNHAGSSNMERRVRKALPLARFLQIPTVVIVG